ncbi:MAG: Gfo/Idh/MocA family oxidoreductase [Bacteroidota bacterium]
MVGLIIGLGSIARQHVAAIRELDKEIVLYALRSSKTGSKVEGVSNVYNLDTARQINPNFVIISNPTSLHFSTINQLVDWNTPLFIEKPVLDSLKNSSTLSQQLAEAKTKTYVGCNLRFLECLVFLKDFVKNKRNRINEVNIYCGSHLPSWRPNTDFRQSYSARPELGGGVHLDCIHELDYAYWIFGRPTNVQSIKRSTSTLEIPAIDYANYNLGYDNFCVNVTLNYFRKDYKRTVEVLLDEQTIEVNLATNSIIDHQGNCLFKSSNNILNTYRLQMAYFLNFIKNPSAQSLNPIEQGIDVLRICLNE